MEVASLSLFQFGKYLTKLVIYFNFIKCIFLLVAKFMVYWNCGPFFSLSAEPE